MDRKTRKANLKKLQLPAIGQPQQTQQPQQPQQQQQSCSLTGVSSSTSACYPHYTVTKTAIRKSPNPAPSSKLDEIAIDNAMQDVSYRANTRKRVKLDTFLNQNPQKPNDNLSKTTVNLAEQPANMQDSLLEIPEKKSKIAPKITKTRSNIRKQSKVKGSSGRSSTKIPKQMNIKSAFLRNEQMFAELAAQHSAAEQFDGDEIQLALAISKSEHDTQCIQKSVNTMHVEGLDEQIKSPDTNKGDIYRKKLEKYGFRTASKEDYKTFALNCMPGIWNRRPKSKWANKFTALTLRDADKQLQKLHKNVEEILANYEKYHKSSLSPPTSLSAHCLISQLLRQCQANERDSHGILAIDHYDVVHKLEEYFVRDLFAISDISAGYLLRDWSKIQGRDLSPNKKDPNSLKRELQLEEAYRDLEQYFARTATHMEDSLHGLNISLYCSKTFKKMAGDSEIPEMLSNTNTKTIPKICEVIESKPDSTLEASVSHPSTSATEAISAIDTSSQDIPDNSSLNTNSEKVESSTSNGTQDTVHRAMSPDLFADSDNENHENALNITRDDVNKGAVHGDSCCTGDKIAEDVMDATITTYEIYSSDEVNKPCILEVNSSNNLDQDLSMEQYAIVDLTQCDISSPSDINQSEENAYGEAKTTSVLESSKPKRVIETNYGQPKSTSILGGNTLSNETEEISETTDGEPKSISVLGRDKPGSEPRKASEIADGASNSICALECNTLSVEPNKARETTDEEPNTELKRAKETSGQEIEKMEDLTFNISSVSSDAEVEAESKVTGMQSSNLLNNESFLITNDSQVRNSGNYSQTDPTDDEIFERLCKKYLGYTNSTQPYVDDADVKESHILLNKSLSMPVTYHHHAPDDVINLETENSSESLRSLLNLEDNIKRTKEDVTEEFNFSPHISLNKGRKSKSFTVPVSSISNQNANSQSIKTINSFTGQCLEAKNISKESELSIDLTHSDDDNDDDNDRLSAADNLSSKERKAVNDASDDASSDDDCCLLLSDDEINYSIWKSNRTPHAKKSLMKSDDYIVINDGDDDDDADDEALREDVRLRHLQKSPTVFNTDAEFAELHGLITPTKFPYLAAVNTSGPSSPISCTPKHASFGNYDCFTPSNTKNTSTKSFKSIEYEDRLQSSHLPEDFEQLLVGELRTLEDKHLPTTFNSSNHSRTRTPPTPSRNCSPQQVEINGRIYTVRYTEAPKPEFTQMTDVELWKHLSAYGIKPLKRKHAVKMLEYIYNQTHPIIENAIDPTTPVSGYVRKSTSQLNTEWQQGIATVEDLRSDSDLSDKELQATQDAAFNTYQLNAAATGAELLRYSDSFQPEFVKEEFIMQTNVTRKTPRPLLPLHIAWYNLICANRKLHEAVLMFEPIDLHEIYLHFKYLGYRYEPKDLKTFFDQRCIVFRYDMTSNHKKPNFSSRPAYSKARQQRSVKHIKSLRDK